MELAHGVAGGPDLEPEQRARRDHRGRCWCWCGGGYGGGGAEGGEGCFVDLGGDLDPLGVLEAGEGVDGVDAEGAVGVAFGLEAAGDEGRLELAHGVAGGADLEPEQRARRDHAAGAVPASAAAVASSTTPVALSPLADWNCLTAAAVPDTEDPVDATGHVHAGGDQRLLQATARRRPDFPAGDPTIAEAVGRGMSDGRRHDDRSDAQRRHADEHDRPAPPSARPCSRRGIRLHNRSMV